MNISDAKTFLSSVGVRPTDYRIGSADPLGGDAHVLLHEHGSWVVFFSERGERNDQMEFETEDEACTELVDRLMSDDGLRSVPPEAIRRSSTWRTLRAWTGSTWLGTR